MKWITGDSGRTWFLTLFASGLLWPALRLSSENESCQIICAQLPEKNVQRVGTYFYLKAAQMQVMCPLNLNLTSFSDLPIIEANTNMINCLHNLGVGAMGNIRDFKRGDSRNLGRARRTVVPKGGGEKLVIAYANDSGRYDGRYLCSVYIGFPSGWVAQDLAGVVHRVDSKVRILSDAGLSVGGIEYEGGQIRKCIADFSGKGEDGRCRWCIEFRGNLAALARERNQEVEERGNCPAMVYEGKPFHRG